MYYGILTVSVILFGIQFLFNNNYQKVSGSGMGPSFTFSFLGSIAGLICLLIINKFTFSATPFTVIVATVAAINSITYSFCSLKAFERINLSLYSIFAMLGGMMLPFVVGLIFYDEPMTLGKAICLVFVIAALFLTLDKGRSKGGEIYYLGVFTLNGMSGVIAKFFNSAPFEKTNAASYSIWIAIMTLLISGTILLFIRKNLNKPNGKALIFSFGGGALSQVANFLLLIALAVLPASVQYPFVTGGIMIVYTLISAICGQKPSKKELLSVILSFVGILALVFI